MLLLFCMCRSRTDTPVDKMLSSGVAQNTRPASAPGEDAPAADSADRNEVSVCPDPVKKRLSLLFPGHKWVLPAVTVSVLINPNRSMLQCYCRWGWHWCTDRSCDWDTLLYIVFLIQPKWECINFCISVKTDHKNRKIAVNFLCHEDEIFLEFN